MKKWLVGPIKVLPRFGVFLDVVSSSGVRHAVNSHQPTEVRLCYSAGPLKILRELKTNPPVPGARVLTFVENITTIFPPESA